MPASKPAPSASTSALSIGNEIVGLLAQLLLVFLSARIIWAEDDDLDTLRLLGWCLVASLYLGGTILMLNILVRIDQGDPPATRIIIRHPLTRVLSTVLTFASSLLGITVALELIVNIGTADREPFSEFSAVWAMLLSWSMFHWGFARIYFSRYHRAAEPSLLFPGTDEPRLIDFVYLAFTNATTFAVSDVQVTATRMRWTIVWHTTLAFFFNALIIALTMNVISSGALLSDLVS